MTQFSSSLFYSHIRDRPRGGTFRCIFHYLNSVMFPRHLPSNIVKAIALFLKICILLNTLCLIFCLFVWSVWIKPLPLICKLGFHFGLCFLFVCFVFLSYLMFLFWRGFLLLFVYLHLKKISNKNSSLQLFQLKGIRFSW